MTVSWKLQPGPALGIGRHASVWPAEAAGRRLAVRIGRMPADGLPPLQLANPFVMPILEAGTLDVSTAAKLCARGIDTVAGAPFHLLPRAQSLDHFWDAHPSCDWALAVRLMDDLLRGLIAVHLWGATHGDICPANLLVGSDGRLRLHDLGSPRGSPGFESPEQGTLGPSVATDLYAAGATLFWLLSNETPGNSTFRPALPVPEGTERWIQRMLGATEPFADAAAARQALPSPLHHPGLPRRIRPLGWGSPAPPPFVARQKELTTLRKLWKQDQAELRVWAVEGLPGAGTTRLALQCAQEAAEEGWEVWATDMDGLSSILEKNSESHIPHAPEGLRDALALRKSSRPLLLLLDRGIEQSAALRFADLSRGLPLNILVLLTGSIARMSAAVRDLWQRTQFPVLSVPPLSGAELNQLLRAALPEIPPGLGRRCQGLPGVALALGRAARGGGVPEDLHEFWSGALRQAAPTQAARKALRLLAISPPPVPRGLWERLVGNDVTALQNARIAGLLAEDPTHLSLAWPLVQELLTAESTEEDHSHWLTLLQGTTDLARLGWHQQQLGLHEAAVRSLSEAATIALHRSDYAGALTLLEQATPSLQNLSYPPRARYHYLRLRACAGMAQKAEELAEVDRIANQMLQEARTPGDRRSMGLALGYRGLAARRRKDPWVARALLALATDYLEDGDVERVRLLSNLADVHRLLGETNEAVQVAERARDASRAVRSAPSPTDEEELAHARNEALRALGTAQISAGLAEAARLSLEEAAAGFERIGNLFGIGNTANALGVLARRQRRNSEATRLFSRAAQVLTPLRSPDRILPALNLGMLALSIHDFSLMEDHFRTALGCDPTSLAGRLGLWASLALQNNPSASKYYPLEQKEPLPRIDDVATLLEEGAMGMRRTDSALARDALLRAAELWESLGNSEGGARCRSFLPY